MNNNKSFIDIILSCGENSDMWEDVFFSEAYQSYQNNKSRYDLRILIDQSKQLSLDNQKRFWQVVSSVEQVDQFDVFLLHIQSQIPEIAIYIIDGLREWNLNSEQREKLRISAEKLKGISQVYDLILRQI
ncbi:MAG: hypothetical protein MUC87_04240 [Bacteroidia bacterium]|jgi:hypothetical protein|nr:hypothetical protein [Bacteroidia bacterium]